MALKKEEVVRKVRDAGVVGGGGAGFPTHVKISAEADFVIANGAECEPILRTDQYLMVEKNSEILRGLEIVRDISSAQTGFVALKSKYKKAVELFRKNRKPGIEVFELDSFYPAGDEQVLVCEVTGRVVPEAGIPIDVGVIVDNVGTLINVCEAVEKRKSVTRKYVTVTGEVEKPIVVKCAIGAKIADVVALAKPKLENYAIISGGPMMGEIVSGDDVITKTTGALIVLPLDSNPVERRLMKDTVAKRRAKSICDQCMDCTLVCPRNLIGHRIYPHKIMRMNFFETNELNEITSGSFLCVSCGLCEIACPQGLSPRSVFKLVKENLISKGLKNILTEPKPTTHPVRDLRKFPAERVVQRLGIRKYDVPAQFYQREFIPDKVKIPFLQHVGVPSQPVVKVGDEVKAGQLIAKIPDGKIGANMHSSIDGTVVNIDEKFVYIE
ncbi:MAG: 4Fe-4S dicluster domain-containing protein [Elusimicrobia bacterium]|nr:4Fe-4S dicluster domain-containing protein [Elusimicrobiota bacterium]